MKANGKVNGKGLDMKNQIDEYREQVECAKNIWNKGHEMMESIPYIPSSNSHDVVLICLHSLYHAGRIPYFLRKSRGYSWVVDGEKVTVTDYKDHRDGVKTI